MSLADTLLGDFSDSDSDSDHEITSFHNESDNALTTNSARHNGKYRIEDLLTITDMETIESITMFCPILKKIDVLQEKLKIENETNDIRIRNKLRKEEQTLLTDANALITEMNTYFTILFSFIKINYSQVWPDLVTILKNPLMYIKVVQIVGFDINDLKRHNNDLEFLPKDQILSLTMSSNFLVKTNQSKIPTSHTQKLLNEACEILTQINQSQIDFRNFMTNRIQLIAPNICELIGPVVASQLISTLSLESLSATPACNIPSIGKSINNSLGYINNCDLVKNTSEEFKKQAIRQVSGKLVLAARVDLGASNSNTNDTTLGAKWRTEIQAKLDKLMLPPENVQIKPLPIPADQKSKRRGGRKFKKMRDRMKMSEVEKAQNKMVFGEEEVTRRDAFGEEIGLGMLGKTSVRAIGTVRAVQVSKGAQKKLDTFSKVTKPQHSESKLADLL